MTKYATYPVHTSLQPFIQMDLIVQVDELEPLIEVFTAKPIASLLFNFAANQPPIIGSLIFEKENIPNIRDTSSLMYCIILLYFSNVQTILKILNGYPSVFMTFFTVKDQLHFNPN
jgi:hypothetical protein